MFLIIQFGSKKTPAIKSCIESFGEFAVVQEWKSISQRPSGLKGIIFSGSPAFFTEVDHQPYVSEISPLLTWNVPVLGICFGHQLMGILHGANIYRGDPIRTNEKIRLLKTDQLFHGFQDSFEMQEDHTEGIDVPLNFTHLATSTSYINEAMKHKEKHFWGVQFHPEVSGENGLRLFRNFISVCNENTSKV